MAQVHDSIRAEFVKGAAAKEQFPPSSAPEVAMIGRSNVGKSSLINSILRTGAVARVSNTPGKTQEINFFMTDMAMMFVDLPGYGYAKVSKERRLGFSKLIKDYLFTREQLRVVCVLIDSRHDPQPLDLAMLEDLELHGVPFVAVLTKTDKLSKGVLEARKVQITELLSQCKHSVDVVGTSAKEGDGRSELIGIIKRMRTIERVVS